MITDYESLKKEIIDWTHRDDLDTRIDTFIQMAENEMYNNSEALLEIRGQERTTVLVMSGQNLALPTDYMVMRSMRVLVDNNNQTILYRAPEQMLRDSSTGQPEFFTVTTDIEFNRVPDSAYDLELKYYAMPLPLNENNTTNEILDDNANIYLLGSLWAASLFIQSDQTASYYGGFISAIRGSNRKAKKGRYGPAPQMTIAQATP